MRAPDIELAGHSLLCQQPLLAYVPSETYLVSADFVTMGGAGGNNLFASSADLHDRFQETMLRWSRGSHIELGPEIVSSFSSTSTDSIIVLAGQAPAEFALGEHGVDVHQVLANTFYTSLNDNSYDSDNYYVSIEVYQNDRMWEPIPWTWDVSPNGISLRDVLAHEIGHAIGLGHEHRSYGGQFAPRALMFPFAEAGLPMLIGQHEWTAMDFLYFGTPDDWPPGIPR